MTETKPLRNICIVGNISSGKSTLTTLLANAIPNSVAIPEEFANNAFLELYVAEPPRWAFTNAVRYFYDYVRVYHELTTGHSYQHCFIDAGGATNRFVYGRYLRDEKIMTREENDFYELLCRIIERAYAYPECDAYIFLQSVPEKCFARMIARGWDYQKDFLKLDYLRQIEKYHRAFQQEIHAQHLPALDLDSDALDFTSEQGRAETLQRVREFLES